MNSMKKKLLTAFGITATIAFSSIIVYQTDVISKLTKNLQSETRRADSAEREVAVKNQMIEELSDSIEVLHMEIATLNETIATQKSAINKLNRILKSQEEKVAELTKEISILEKTGAANWKKINQLQEERETMLLKMEEYDKYRQTVKDIQAEAERKQKEEQKKLESAQRMLKENEPSQSAPVMEAPPVILNQPPSSEPPMESPNINSPMSEVIKNEQQERLANIKSNTTVKFSDITMRKKETSNNLKKIDPKDWRYTFIEFDLNNPAKDLILEETFVLQLFDLDNNQVVPMNESNPGFPESEQGRTGYKFRYKGAPITVRYFNNQRKEGVNYEIRLFYLKSGLFFPLDNGTKLIVQNGEVI